MYRHMMDYYNLEFWKKWSGSGFCVNTRSLSLCVIMCCTVDSCVDVINISPGTLTQSRGCEEYRDFVILILHQQ